MFLFVERGIPYRSSNDEPATDRERGWLYGFGPLFAAVILLFRPLLSCCYLADILLLLRLLKSPKSKPSQ
jgi:hypothetical protein